MADELIALYAKRMSVKGYAFSPMTRCSGTLKSTSSTRRPTTSCGASGRLKRIWKSRCRWSGCSAATSGFGKTEVALRAAFKCVLDGKQCAILCPTTILAWQHYQTITARMGNYPVTIELLSRFRSPKEQKEIMAKLERGLIDVIVGTHRLISKDVHFKDLGLAIIDEEQRFASSPTRSGLRRCSPRSTC